MNVDAFFLSLGILFDQDPGVVKDRLYSYPAGAPSSHTYRSPSGELQLGPFFFSEILYVQPPDGEFQEEPSSMDGSPWMAMEGGLSMGGSPWVPMDGGLSMGGSPWNPFHGWLSRAFPESESRPDHIL